MQDVKDGWALVEVYEHKSEATTTGWVNRRALRSPVRDSTLATDHAPAGAELHFTPRGARVTGDIPIDTERK